MENNQILKADMGTPNVSIDKEFNILVIEGVCMPENAVIMFKPIFDAINELNKEKIVVNLTLKYINSMSSKQLLRLLFTLIDEFNSVVINWNYSNGDELMKMKGEELKSIVELDNFEIIEV